MDDIRGIHVQKSALRFSLVDSLSLDLFRDRHQPLPVEVPCSGPTFKMIQCLGPGLLTHAMPVPAPEDGL